METVVFEPARNGGVMAQYNWKIGFPEKRGPQPQAWEEWEVIGATLNPKGTVYFLKLGKKIDVEAREREEERLAIETYGGFLDDYEVGDAMERSIDPFRKSHFILTANVFSVPGGSFHDRYLQYKGMSQEQTREAMRKQVEEYVRWVESLPSVVLVSDSQMFPVIHRRSWKVKGAEEWQVRSKCDASIDEIKIFFLKNGMVGEIEEKGSDAYISIMDDAYCHGTDFED